MGGGDRQGEGGHHLVKYSFKRIVRSAAAGGAQHPLVPYELREQDPGDGSDRVQEAAGTDPE